MTFQLDLFSFVIKLVAHKAPMASINMISQASKDVLLKPLAQKKTLERNPFRF